MNNKKDIVMKIRIPRRLYKKIKIKANKEYTTMTDIIREAIVRRIK